MSSELQESGETSASSPSGEISRLADHLFRHESGRLVSILTGLFGLDRLQWAEDVVQEALVRALQTWPYYGVPKNPAAWLTQTAKNLAVDLLRREQNFQRKQDDVIAFIENSASADTAADHAAFDHEIKDARLRLMFVCCHPQIPPESQTALSLKTLCGFSPAEIARAFLTSEAAIAKRLTRARQRIRELRLPFEIPPADEMPARLEGVWQTLYLLFNEGYKASSGDNLVREDLCFEAIRLASLLAENPVGNKPATHALLALMLLNAARLATRTDAAGQLLRLKEQDRTQWDRPMIHRGMVHLARSAAGDEITAYHLQAGIAACHCAAPHYDATDWKQILALYDRWVDLDDSPVVALNRAVAIAQIYGPAAGIEAVRAIQSPSAIEGYYLLYAVLAEFYLQLQQFPAAAAEYRRALEYTEVTSERAFLQARLRKCEDRALTSAPDNMPSETGQKSCAD